MRLKGFVGPALLHVRVVKTGLYRAEKHVSVESVQEQLEAVKAVLDRRVNGLGVAESTLQTIGDSQLDM